jgi:hypothetical protein
MHTQHSPRVGDVYVSQGTDHPIPVRIHAIGTNHVRVFPVKKKRRTDAGRWVKVSTEQFNTHYRPLRG